MIRGVLDFNIIHWLRIMFSVGTWTLRLAEALLRYQPPQIARLQDSGGSLRVAVVMAAVRLLDLVLGLWGLPPI